MYTYTCDISYVGSNAFVLFLWPRITRGTGVLKQQFKATPAEVAALRTAGTNAGFSFSNITRVPVAAPEVVP